MEQQDEIDLSKLRSNFFENNVSKEDIQILLGILNGEILHDNTEKLQELNQYIKDNYSNLRQQYLTILNDSETIQKLDEKYLGQSTAVEILHLLKNEYVHNNCNEISKLKIKYFIN